MSKPKPSPYKALKARVSNRGSAPDAWLAELIAWGKSAPDELFEFRNGFDVYSSVKAELGPWSTGLHRRAVMLEVMRVLAGFESTWKWSEGRDVSNPASDTAPEIEAGAWQVSADSMAFGADLKALVLRRVKSLRAADFQAAMKADHALAMEYIARLLRHTVNHNGPVKRREINRWLSRDAVAEFEKLLT